MKKTAIICAICLVLAGCGSNRPKPIITVEPLRELPSIGFFKEDYAVDSTIVKTGESVSTLFNRLGLGSADTYAMTNLCEGVFDVRKLRAGNSLEAYYSGDSLSRKLEYIEYHHDKIKSTVFQCGDSLAVWEFNKPTMRVRKYSDVTIKSSLWNDMIAANASPALITDLADIYQWSVNFFGLQEGDRFQMIYSQVLCEGEVIKIDTIYFCMYTGAKKVPAMLYKTEEGGKTYWGENGESLKRMFLKAPLKYNRISSGFSYHRVHPVTGKVKAHTAVDYAAPTGTPVHAIGDGTITLAGWDGSGGGNRIRIKHAQGYESCYMHLSKFAPGMKAGRRVSQGELIGYVGATGTATGPHLDFRIWQNGKPINPLSLDSPASAPLDSKYLDEFNLQYNSYIKELEAHEH